MIGTMTGVHSALSRVLDPAPRLLDVLYLIESGAGTCLTFGKLESAIRSVRGKDGIHSMLQNRIKTLWDA
jgi:hypothetical protein